MGGKGTGIYKRKKKKKLAPILYKFSLRGIDDVSSEEKAIAYKKRNIGRIRAKWRKWYRSHHSKAKAKMRNYYYTHREEILNKLAAKKGKVRNKPPRPAKPRPPKPVEKQIRRISKNSILYLFTKKWEDKPHILRISPPDEHNPLLGINDILRKDYIKSQEYYESKFLIRARKKGGRASYHPAMQRKRKLPKEKTPAD